MSGAPTSEKNDVSRNLAAVSRFCYQNELNQSVEMGKARQVGLKLAATVVCLLANPVYANDVGRTATGLEVNAPGSAGSTAPEPGSLTRVEQDYLDARAALRRTERALDDLHQEERRLRRDALTRRGSWIEPAALWRKKQVLQQTLVDRREAERMARKKLYRARTDARQLAEKAWSKARSPSWFSSWWQW